MSFLLMFHWLKQGTGRDRQLYLMSRWKRRMRMLKDTLLTTTDPQALPPQGRNLKLYIRSAPSQQRNKWVLEEGIRRRPEGGQGAVSPGTQVWSLRERREMYDFL